MKKSMKIMVVVLCIVAFPIISTGQSLSINNPEYRSAVGLRGGELGGLTYKQFASPDRAFEIILGLGYRNPAILSLTGLYEKHVPAFSVSGMKWYYGGGGHAVVVGSHSGYYRHPWGRYRYYYESGAIGLGIDGIVGLEYKIPPIPFAISFDLKPYIEVMSPGGIFWSLDPALGIKLTF